MLFFWNRCYPPSCAKRRGLDLIMSRVARFVLWFFTTYTIVIVVHEAAHALTAYGVGLTAVLHQFWVDIDNHSTLAQRSAYGVAGPLASLAIGTIACAVYWRVRAAQRHSVAATQASARWATFAVPLAYLSANGLGNFFGNLMSTAFIGDFSNVAKWTGMPMAARYAASFVGAVMVSIVLFVAGRELRRWVPARMSRSAAAGTAVLLPVVLGTTLIIVINEPTNISGFESARIGEGAFWIFGAAGAFLAPPAQHSDEDGDRLRWQDIVSAVVAVAIVRLLVAGFTLHR